jgi:hypothetical protein
LKTEKEEYAEKQKIQKEKACRKSDRDTDAILKTKEDI